LPMKQRLENRPLGVAEVHVAISTRTQSSATLNWPYCDL
jgi:hypothetical protein